MLGAILIGLAGIVFMLGIIVMQINWLREDGSLAASFISGVVFFGALILACVLVYFGFFGVQPIT